MGLPQTSISIELLDKLSAFATGLWEEQVILQEISNAVYVEGMTHCVMVVEVADLDSASDTITIGVAMTHLAEHDSLKGRVGPLIVKYPYLAVIEVHMQFGCDVIVARSARSLFKDANTDSIHTSLVYLNSSETGTSPD